MVAGCDVGVDLEKEKAERENGGKKPYSGWFGVGYGIGLRHLLQALDH